MGFLGIYTAVYDYAPQGEGELPLAEGDLLYVLEKSGEDDWWKAKKKATPDEEEEPVGLVPANYIEEAQPTHSAKALYDYTRQTDEELSFKEGATLQVYDTSDPDWILVGLDNEYGFVPSNYIELGEAGAAEEAAPPTPARPLPPRQVSEESEDFSPAPESPASPPNPAAALAGVMHQRQQSQASSVGPPQPAPRPTVQFSPEPEEDEAPPPMPRRPQSQDVAPARSLPSPRESRPVASPPATRVQFAEDHDDRKYDAPQLSGGGFHLYNVNEMVSVMGKRKKMPTVLGINMAKGVITLAPEKTRDGPQQEWTVDKMAHYSIEGKHVFLEFVKPSKSLDLHAGSKDTAHEIVAGLGEMAGAMRAEGLKEVWSAASGKEKKKGKMLYDFMAQGDDEVSVAVDDEVIILDDTKSDEWWQVRRIKNGKEGVVPSSYVEIIGTIAYEPASRKGINAGMSTVEQNRIEEQRLAKEALKAGKAENDRGSEVGPGMLLPPRQSSLHARVSSSSSNHEHQRTTSGSRRDSRHPDRHSHSSKSKPDLAKVRTWTDRSKSFSVEAQFLALKDGKINLHKMNGVKIAVPVSKMSVEDLEYVERMTGVSLDEDKPLSDLKKKRESMMADTSSNRGESSRPTSGAVIQKNTGKEYDWFQFFLNCDISVGLCERYSQVFNRDNMDESVLPDVDSAVLRNLGLREGDILKVMRHLDQRFGRKKGSQDAEGGETGLFSGPGGTLRNNTRKGRPAPPVETSNTVDPNAFKVNEEPAPKPVGRPLSPAQKPPAPISKMPGGFDDDAWDVKPSSTPQPQAQQAQQSAPTPAPAQQPALTGAMQELSLLSQPLQPTKHEPPPPALPLQQQQPPPPQQAPQPTGATPGFFQGLPQQPTGMQPQQHSAAFQSGFQSALPQQQTLPRQRPQAPQYSAGASTLQPPPPARPLSAPQTTQSAFGPPPQLQPQMTGIPHQPTGFASVAPPGQPSLAQINEMRQQQQAQQFIQQQQQAQQQQMQGMQMNGYNPALMPQQTGYMQPQQTGFGGQPGMINGGGPFSDSRIASPLSPMGAQPTGFQPQSQFGMQGLQPQPTGFQPQSQFGMSGMGMQPQQTGVNSFLPQPLQPQRTGVSPVNGFGQQGGFQAPPMPPMPTGPVAQPLVPQKTGPPPPVRFGVKPGEPKRLVSQPTGRRANLAAATPDNPFGF